MCRSSPGGRDDVAARCIGRWMHEVAVRDGLVTDWQGHYDTAMLAEAYHATPVGKLAAGA